jgi:hypothetical protein
MTKNKKLKARRKRQEVRYQRDTENRKAARETAKSSPLLTVEVRNRQREFYDIINNLKLRFLQGLMEKTKCPSVFFDEFFEEIFNSVDQDPGFSKDDTDQFIYKYVDKFIQNYLEQAKS